MYFLGKLNQNYLTSIYDHVFSSHSGHAAVLENEECTIKIIKNYSVAQFGNDMLVTGHQLKFK